jgi:putative transposase
MKRDNSLCHTKWECKYHIVWIPKRRRKVLFEKLRKFLGELFHKLASERECRIVAGHLCVDHVHMCIEIAIKQI